jgi:hypothetical protein
MPTYKATKIGEPVFYKNCVDLAAAETYFIATIGTGFTIKLAEPNEQMPDKTDAEKLAERQSFGTNLLNQYLLDNDAIAAARGEPLTVTESNQQAAKFQAVMGVLPLGSLRQALAIIQATPTDTIFTQERKDNYIAQLTNFIASQ